MRLKDGIVTKMNELMAWCDELESLLQTASETATRFAKATSTLRIAAAIAR